MTRRVAVDLVKAMVGLGEFTVAQVSEVIGSEQSNVREWLYEFEAAGLVRNPKRAKAFTGQGMRHKGLAPGKWRWTGVAS